ncbi:MAG: glycoside hydrolase family 5 protein, partial [Anaerolineales bacterium]|nr:glycoside hydrolase family 5 protein [Anaerolineales bacterium]
MGILTICGALLVIAPRYGHLSITLPLEDKVEFANENIALFPSRLHASSNQIVDESGVAVILRGVMPPDPAVLKRRGKFNREFFDEIRATHANIIRIPVHPERWVRDEDYLWRYLDPIVSWAGELNMYVIINWHYIGNVATGAGPQMPDIETAPKYLTLEFWRLTARYFRDAPNVIFEIFNEPQSIGAEEWRNSVGEIIQAIREQDARQLIVVGGIDYGKDLSWAIEHPIDDDNISYASHIYPAHSSYLWGHWFGAVGEKYPVLVTEWGFMDENRNTSQSYLAGDQISYGQPFLEYLDSQHIGWVACWY